MPSSLRLLDQEEAVASPGDRALDQDQVPLGVDAHDGQLLDGDPLVAHVARHAGVEPGPAGRRARPDRAGLPVVRRPVRLGPALEIVARDRTGKALALALADDVDQLPGLEQGHVHHLARLVALDRVDPELGDVSRLRGLLVEVRELAGDRLADLARGAGHQLERGIAVPLRGPEPRHGVRGSLDDAHGHDGAVVLEDPRHPELSPDQSCRHLCLSPPGYTDGAAVAAPSVGRGGRGPRGYILISISTPAASDSRISASTVFVDGSMMSIRRLCVRISNCSRPSLCTNGPRMTVYFSIRVGSGTGPATSAPVRCAVSTICSADWSSNLWSYALSRMRMRCLAIGQPATSVITPAPTVWPPSRIAKRCPCSMAIGVISSTSMLTLSPGMIISTPAGISIAPVTSVVRR